MDVFSELFNDWTGILTLAVLTFMLGMGVFYLFYFLRKSGEDG